MRILADRTVGVAHAAGRLRCTGGILLRVRGGKTRPAPNHAHGNPGALAAAGRILFAPIPDFKPVSAICIIAGAVFGKHSGFMVGALAALCSNFFFGQGPWTPWQMYAWGLVGYVAGVLANNGVFALSERLGAHGPSLGTVVLLCYGFLSGLGYGFILNSWYIVAFLVPVTWQGALAAYLAGLPLDLVHSVAAVIFLSALYLPWKRKLERIKRKYALR